MAAGWCLCTGWPPLPGMPGMRRGGGWRRCSWSGCARSARRRPRRRSGWIRSRCGGGIRRFARAGWPARRDPKGASKLTPQLAARIRELDAAGARLSQIAAAAGVSTFSVRNALGRVAARGQGAAAGTAAGSAGLVAEGDGERLGAVVKPHPGIA